MLIKNILRPRESEERFFLFFLLTAQHHGNKSSVSWLTFVSATSPIVLCMYNFVLNLFCLLANKVRGGGYSQIDWVEVCHWLRESPTLYKSKFCKFCDPIVVPEYFNSQPYCKLVSLSIYYVFHVYSA